MNEKKNSGYYNSGDHNSGNRNSGNHNSGNHNSGNHNSGNHNSGNHNSGNHNSGDCNSGNHNSGDCNSGHYNSGDCNSGHCNSGHCNSGHFNTDEPTVRMFNKDTGLLRKDIFIPYIHLVLNKWISWDDMSYEDRKNNPKAKNTDGMLVTFTYKEAWKNYWVNLGECVKKQFKDLPNFCPKIFEEITGININADNKVEILCEGKKVYISRKSAKALNLID